MTSITTYLKQSGTVIVPDGVYSGGNGVFHHSTPLTLKPASPGGVILDLSGGMLNLWPGSSNVTFDGIIFRNGTVKLQGCTDITFHRTDHTFPPDEWYRQWVAAGGGHDVPMSQGLAAMKAMPNPHPDCLVTAGANWNGTWVECERVAVLGADVHDVCATGITVAGKSMHIAGTKVWNCSEIMSNGLSADPGYGGVEVDPLEGQHDAFHPDSVFAGGGLSDSLIEHSCFLQRIQWGAQVGAIYRAVFNDLWLAGSSTAGIVVDAINHTNSGAMTNIRSFGNRYGVRVDIGRPPNSGNAVWPKEWYPALTMSGIDTSSPVGDMQLDGTVNVAKVLADPTNPANVWRKANL